VETLIAEMDDTPNELVAAAFVVLCDQINRLLRLCETTSANEDGDVPA